MNSPPRADVSHNLESELSDLRERQQRLFADLAAGQLRFRRLARSVLAVQEQERRRLARELHDGLGQNLAVLKHDLEAMAASTSHDEALTLLSAHALELCSAILEDTRQLSRLLRPQILDDLGLAAALNWLLRTLPKPGGFEAEMHVDADLSPLDEEASTLLFRVAQEALNNISRHAHAKNVVLRLSMREGFVRLLVMDDGIGYNPVDAFASSSRGESTGLAAMRERVQLFGGELHLNSIPGEGTQLRVNLPLDPADHNA
jgi:two-component system NarL family sensor kinase